MLRLIVGVSRKLGLPSYSSAGSSCQIEVELPSGLLEENPQKFRDEVRRAYAAAHQAVDDDLAPWKSLSDGTPACRQSEISSFEGGSRFAKENSRQTRRATDRQLHTLATLAKRRQLDIDELVFSLGVDGSERLSVAQASVLIGRLQSNSWI
jgi:hypothetical protein